MAEKLVRDKIPEIIEAKGGSPKIRIASENEYFGKLLGKLNEEIKEFSETPNEEEIADIIEVVKAICNFKNWDEKEIEKLREDKAKKRGSFKDRIILDM